MYRSPLTQVLLLNRIAVFQFIIDDTVEEPTIEFISEDPYLQYVRIKPTT